MYEIPLSYMQHVRKYEKIETDGLTLYPILVDEHDAFLAATPAIDIMQRTLPAQYISMPLLSAYFKMDVDAVLSGNEPSGMFSRAMLFLALALRLGRDKDMFQRGEVFRITVDPNDTTRLKSIQADGLPPITPVMFHRLRHLLAAQNGIRLTDDDENPELVQAERDIAEQNATPLDIRLEDMITTVALASRVDEREIYEWPIAKLYARSRAYQRSLDYVVCNIAASQGTSWRGGNPAPSPFYDKQKTDSAALISLSKMPSGAVQS